MQLVLYPDYPDKDNHQYNSVNYDIGSGGS